MCFCWYLCPCYTSVIRIQILRVCHSMSKVKVVPCSVLGEHVFLSILIWMFVMSYVRGMHTHLDAVRATAVQKWTRSSLQCFEKACDSADIYAKCWFRKISTVLSIHPFARRETESVPRCNRHPCTRREPEEHPTMSMYLSNAHTHHRSSETVRGAQINAKTFETMTMFVFVLSLPRFPFNVKIGSQSGDSAADIPRNWENKLCQDAKRSRHPSRMEQNRAIRVRHPSKDMLWTLLESELCRQRRRSLFYTVKHAIDCMKLFKSMIHYAFSVN